MQSWRLGEEWVERAKGWKGWKQMSRAERRSNLSESGNVPPHRPSTAEREDPRETARELRQETEVRLQHDRLSAVIHSLEDALFLLDKEGRVTLANAAAEKLLPKLRVGRLGNCSQCSNQLKGEREVGEPASCMECLSDYQRPAQLCELTVEGRIHDIQCTPLRGPDGSETERIFLSRDVTEKRHAAALQARQERLTVLGEVAAVMAHELNNPLAAISMFSQMLVEELEPSSPLHTHAEVVHRNTLNCKKTLRSLIDLAGNPSTEPKNSTCETWSKRWQN